MAITRPSIEEVLDIAADLGMSFTHKEASDYLELMQGNFDAYDVIDAMPDNLPEVKYPRTPGHYPRGEDNKYGAWYFKTTIKGAAQGKLSGKTVAVKDNVSVAGVPMMNGASSLQGFVPSVDATIITRLLDAGATIVGKTTCEYFCLSGGSHTSSPAAVHNPRKMGYSAGGSSSGSAAVIAAGEVDLAIGGDQGGSIRIPASYCGIYGMKPTHGLVPYTGVMPIEATIDHTGPMSANVRDNAVMLEVIAGPDGLDPRQYAPKVTSYTDKLDTGVGGLKIGILKEAFSTAGIQKGVIDKVQLAAQKLAKMGALVEEVSIPEHVQTMAVWGPIALEGLTAQMMHGNGMGFSWKGFYDVALIDAHASWRDRADDLSQTLKISMLVGQYFLKHYRGRYYAKAQNLRRLMKAGYDKVLGTYDLLLAPTLPMVATQLPGPGAPLAEVCARAFEMIGITAPFDVTGHPAMSIPCGLSDGLPVGLMLIGKDYDEATIYQAASAFEKAGDWTKF